jgi:hypothetical protein
MAPTAQSPKHSIQPGKALDFKAHEWLELELIQSGGFTGLTRRAVVTRAHAISKINAQVLTAISALCEQHKPMSSEPCAPYPDGQMLKLHAKSATAQWQITLNRDQLPHAIAELCTQLEWKPV